MTRKNLSDDRETDEGLTARAIAGDTEALGSLFERYRPRLGGLIRLRLSPVLRKRVAVEDVLQDVMVEALDDFEGFPRSGVPSVYLWLRSVTLSKLIDLQRHHLGVQARDAKREVPLHRGDGTDASTDVLAARLLARWTTPSRVAMRNERLRRLERAIEGLDAIDREIIALRHFEELTNREAALFLEIHPDAASKRHVRALLRLKKALGD